MGTSLIASLATHRLISRYVASLLTPKSHSSHHEQNASLITRSSSFFLLAQETTAFAHLLGGLGPQAFGPAVDLESLSPPHNADWCLLMQTSMASFGARIPAPLARSQSIVICKENNIKPPATRSTSQKFLHIGKCLGTPSLKRANWAIKIHSRGLTEQYLCALEPH